MAREVTASVTMSVALSVAAGVAPSVALMWHQSKCGTVGRLSRPKSLVLIWVMGIRNFLLVLGILDTLAPHVAKCAIRPE